MHTLKTIFTLAIACLAASLAQAKEVTFHAVAVEMNGTKVWLPSTFVVKAGDKVMIYAVSKIPAPGNVHGFAIDELKISETVDDKGKTIEFTAPKPGIYSVRCQLHPAHIGGQLVVLQ